MKIPEGGVQLWDWQVTIHLYVQQHVQVWEKIKCTCWSTWMYNSIYRCGGTADHVYLLECQVTLHLDVQQHVQVRGRVVQVYLPEWQIILHLYI